MITPEELTNKLNDIERRAWMAAPRGWYLMNTRGDLRPAQSYHDLDRDQKKEWRCWLKIGDTSLGGISLLGRTLIEPVNISTVFLGLDHNFEEGPPIVFETMIFGGRLNDEQWRYSTLEQAQCGHRKAVRLAWLARLLGVRLAGMIEERWL